MGNDDRLSSAPRNPPPQTSATTNMTPDSAESPSPDLQELEPIPMTPSPRWNSGARRYSSSAAIAGPSTVSHTSPPPIAPHRHVFGPAAEAYGEYVAADGK